MIEHNLKGVFDYIRFPVTTKFEFKNTSQKYRVFFKFFLINLLIVVLISIITGFLRIRFNINFKETNVQIPMIWVLNLTIIPMTEEIAYRLPLNYKKGNLMLSFVAISYFISSMFFSDGGAVDMLSNLYIRLSIMLFAGFFLYLLFQRKNFEHKISMFWSKHPKIIFYGYLALFTLGHLDNYVLDLAVLILFPILLLPQFIGGVFLSFIRSKFGFCYSVLFHVLVNVFAFVPQFVLYFQNHQ